MLQTMREIIFGWMFPLKKKTIDIGTDETYPASELTNFAEHHFIIDGVSCNSMEGFLQSLKFEDINKQIEVCQLIGKQAKFAGKKKKWWKTQTLFWKGVPMQRDSREYYFLIKDSYKELVKQNLEFRKAL